MDKIIIASDHVAIALKTAVIEHLAKRGVEVFDAGPYDDNQSVDYPDYGQLVARAVANGDYDRGVAICGTGLGISIAANKVPGARVALCHDVYTAHQSRAHNDANVLAMGAWVVSPQKAPFIVDEWLDTPFDGQRHIPRVHKLNTAIPDNALLQTNDQTKQPGFMYEFGVALSLKPTLFGPVMYGGELEEGIKVISQAGFSHLELSVRNPEEVNVPEIKQMLSENNLSIAAIATGQGCIHDDLCLSAMNTDLRNLAIERMKKIIDLAAEFGNVDVILGGVRGKFDLDDRTLVKQRSMAIEAIRELAVYAGKKGIILLLEPINRYETNFINTLEEGKELIDEINELALKLLPDTFHMNIEEADIEMSLQSAKDVIGYIHFADSNRHAPGQGHLDFRSILKTLIKIGYSGKITAEILPLPDEATAVTQTSTFIASIYGKPLRKSPHDQESMK